MELKLVNGDYVFSSRGEASVIGNKEEIAQRIHQKLCAKRGEFLPLQNFGSRLHTLHLLKPSQRESAAQQYIYEALSGEKDVELLSLELLDGEDGNIILNLEFSYLGESAHELNQRIEV